MANKVTAGVLEITTPVFVPAAKPPEQLPKKKKRRGFLQIPAL
jgi:hypothetical protein